MVIIQTYDVSDAFTSDHNEGLLGIHFVSPEINFTVLLLKLESREGQENLGINELTYDQTLPMLLGYVYFWRL